MLSASADSVFPHKVWQEEELSKMVEGDMKVNQGSIDRALRLLAAGVLIGVGLGVVRGPGGVAMAVVGVIPLLT